jgi:two-component system, LytTR family, sensor histidine kinase AlgZ
VSDDPVETPAGFVIPDLCSPQAVLVSILISLLLALTLVLFSAGLFGFDWLELSRAALFILWNMLGSAALLCQLRERIGHWSVARGAMVCYAVILGVCVATNLAYQMVFRELQGVEGRPFDPALLWRDLLMTAMLGGAALRYFHLQGELLKQQRAELNARIESLQARIRPHFLFNSMNIIASLIAVDPERAERAVEDLSELFRASLREGQTTVPFVDELELCDRYLRLEQVRLGERLRLRRRLETLPAALHVPPLCLQPLLENAVYHGIQPLPEGGEIALNGFMEGTTLCIEIVNPQPAGAQTSRGNGMALENIRARLAAIYGGAAGLETHSSGGCFRAVLRIPGEERGR